jgi:hypothetical protein
MPITIRVDWDTKRSTGQEWNELLAWTVETYGLPGEKVSFHPQHDWMDFTFDDEHDALMFQLKTVGIRRYAEEYTVDFVGGLINGR